MTTLLSSGTGSNRRPPGHEMADLIDAVGTETFGDRLVGLLHHTSGADHCAAFRLGENLLGEVASSSLDPARTARPLIDRYVKQDWWRRDPGMAQAQQCLQRTSSSVIRTNLAEARCSELRSSIFPDVRSRLLLCGRRGAASFGLSIVWADPASSFDDSAVGRLEQLAEIVLSLLAKHADLQVRRPNVAVSLTSLDEIENCMVAMSDLPRREMEVCARILYGLSSVGIGLDIKVGEESVKTYRKRAYQRLNIGSERELLTWYLTRWSAWRNFDCVQQSEPGRFGPH